MQVDNDNIWDKYYRVYQEDSLLPGVRYPNEHLVRFMNDWKNSGAWPKDRKPRILELGFGTIANMAMMANFGCNVDGLEVSKNTIGRARNAIADMAMEDILSVDYYKGGAIIPKPDSYYDAVIGLQCVYYNLEQKIFAMECARILKPDGLLFLSFFSSRHGYMKHIDGEPGGPVRFKEGHPNPRLVGLHPFLYSDESQFNDMYGSDFSFSVGIEEFDLLPVYQSWYYLRGQRIGAKDDHRIYFPISTPEKLSQIPLSTSVIHSESMMKKNIQVWSDFVHIERKEHLFSGGIYPDEHVVRFLATWNRRRAPHYFADNIGGEDNYAEVKNMRSLEINPLNPVNLVAMQSFGYTAYGASYMLPVVQSFNKWINRVEADNSIETKKWDGYTLPYRDNKFDLIVATKAAYYQIDQEVFISEVARVLRPEGEIFFYYLSQKHGYCSCIDHVGDNIYRFSSDHPNPHLVGAYVFMSDENLILELWSRYFDVEIKYFEFNTHHTFSSFYVVTGKLRK